MTNEEIINQIDLMFSTLKERDRNSLFGPSEFWEDLCRKHIQLLKDHGFERFKRTINFEYHQWGVINLFRPEIKHVLGHLLSKGQLPYVALMARNKMVSNSTLRIPTNLGAFVYKLFVGLLWQYARNEDHTGCLKACEEPLVGEPLEITYRGRLISQDLALSSLEFNRIMSESGSYPVKRVAEIGAGYGRLAYVFKRMFPALEYCIFDIPPALAISQSYLADSLGVESVVPFREGVSVEPLAENGGKVRSMLPTELASFPDQYFDIMINISSFDEMVPSQIENYFDLIDKKCAGWLYLKGYKERGGDDPNRPFGLIQFPYPERWKCVYEGVDPVQPAFIERMYDLRSPASR